VKILFFWTSIALVSLLTFFVYDKISIIKSTFDPEVSSVILIDIPIIIICGYTALARVIAIFQKVF
jgi:hypothetical protein